MVGGTANSSSSSSAHLGSHTAAQRGGEEPNRREEVTAQPCGWALHLRMYCRVHVAGV